MKAIVSKEIYTDGVSIKELFNLHDFEDNGFIAISQLTKEQLNQYRQAIGKMLD